MADIEKVTKGLECHKNGLCQIDDKTSCPYWKCEKDCSKHLMTDALELLKERQPYKVKNIKNVSGWIIGECPSCGSSLHKEFSPNFCGHCGDAIDWEEVRNE